MPTTGAMYVNNSGVVKWWLYLVYDCGLAVHDRNEKYFNKSNNLVCTARRESPKYALEILGYAIDGGLSLTEESILYLEGGGMDVGF